MLGLVLYYHYSGSFLPAGLVCWKWWWKRCVRTQWQHTQRPQWNWVYDKLVSWGLNSEYGVGVLKVKGENGITELCFERTIEECPLRKHSSVFALLFFCFFLWVIKYKIKPNQPPSPLQLLCISFLTIITRKSIFFRKLLYRITLHFSDKMCEPLRLLTIIFVSQELKRKEKKKKTICILIFSF